MRSLDRSAAFWLRAFPRRWRAQRAAEVAEVLADLAPVGATRLDLRTAAGLVRAGWGVRWRQRPPVGAFLRYRLLGRRPSHAYDGWLRDDLEGALYPWRYALVLDVVLGALFLPLFLLLDLPLVPSAVVVAVGFVATVVDRARGARARSRPCSAHPGEIGPMGPYRPLTDD